MRAVVGAGVPAQMLMQLDTAGVDVRGHEGRQASDALLSSADLVIAMADAHRASIVSIAPAVARRLVLLNELAEAARAQAPLEGDTPAERLANVPRAIAMFRPKLLALSVKDIPDPFGRSDAAYAEAYRMIAADVDSFAAWVMGDEPVGELGVSPGIGSGDFSPWG